MNLHLLPIVDFDLPGRQTIVDIFQFHLPFGMVFILCMDLWEVRRKRQSGTYEGPDLFGMREQIVGDAIRGGQRLAEGSRQSNHIVEALAENKDFAFLAAGSIAEFYHPVIGYALVDIRKRSCRHGQQCENQYSPKRIQWFCPPFPFCGRAHSPVLTFANALKPSMVDGSKGAPSFRIRMVRNQTVFFSVLPL